MDEDMISATDIAEGKSYYGQGEVTFRTVDFIWETRDGMMVHWWSTPPIEADTSQEIPNRVFHGSCLLVEFAEWADSIARE